VASVLPLLNRRSFLGLAALSVASSAGAGGWAAQSILGSPIANASGRGPMPPMPPTMRNRADVEMYRDFRARFVLPEGRVVDNHNGGVSHSEGQGWGMLMAVAFDDEPTFDRLWSWTKHWFRRPGDRLHAWRYQPSAEPPVGDLNNATDGDLYIAGALARGARQWRRPELAAEATAIGQDILRLLVRRTGSRTVLLPGAFGFEKEGGVIVNPSYYVFPLMREVAALVPSPAWSTLETDGIRLISEGRFGPWALPPDWLRIDQRTGALRPAPGWPARFSYDAIRIPLHLAWGGIDAPGVFKNFSQYWNASHPFAPAWADLSSGAIAPYPADAGIRAVAHLALRAFQKRDAASVKEYGSQASHASDYFPSALVVLSRMAASESRSRQKDFDQG